MRIVLVLALAACGTPSTPEPTTTEAPATVEAAEIEAPSVDGETSVYSVESYTSLGSTPPTEPTTLGVMSHMGNIRLILNNLPHYCEPAPEFTVSQEANTLTLTLVQPDAVSRCFGGHNMELVLPGIDMRDPLINHVVIAAADGTELVTGATVRAR